MIWGEGGLFHFASFRFRLLTYPLAVVKLLLKGDWKELTYKIKTKAFKPLRRYVNSRNLGS